MQWHYETARRYSSGLGTGTGTGLGPGLGAQAYQAEHMYNESSSTSSLARDLE